MEPIAILEQLATHIPDLVIQRPHDAPLPQTVLSYGVILFADISGFTALCEKYCSNAKSKSDGTDQLTTALNSYLSQIVQAVLEGGGDILKFAGDALLAFWSCSRFTLTGMLSHVLEITLLMQNDYDNFQTQDGVTLRMKLGLSVGKVEIHYIGNESYRTFDVTGQAIDDANTAQNHTLSGAVVISKMAWETCDKRRCVCKIVGPGCAQVSKLKPEEEVANLPNTENNSINMLIGNWKKRTITNIIAQSTGGEKYTTLEQKLRKGPNPWEEHKNDGRRNSTLSGGGIEIFRVELNFRPKVKNRLPMLCPESQQVLRTYILPTVRHKIDHGHEVSWLSEMREVSVLFINLNPGISLDAESTLKFLQSSFDIVYPSLTKYNGTLNKVFMFDKGCTFLCIFGLPHARHEESTSSALRAARDIFNNLSNLELQGNHSIGVTTGVAFCGVVGHPQRHEYTVIGQKVNMAARLMTNFPGAITCDETTKAKSSLTRNQFTLAPPVSLKGISNPEKIYKFSSENVQDNFHYPSWDASMATDAEDLINRDEEMKIFLEELIHVSTQTNRDTGVIVISGVGGIGKTKLLRAMKAKAAMMNFRVVSGIGGLVEQNTPFFTVKSIVTKLLRIDICMNIHEREQILLESITDLELREMLPLLNDLLVLKFPQTPTTADLVHYSQRTKALRKLLFSIVHQETLTKPCIFGFDDAHWIDPDSWAFLLDLALEPNAIVILTTRPLHSIKNKPPAMIEILEHPNTKVLNLEGLKLDDMVKLACKLMNIENLPEEMKQIIHKRSHGVPLWCEELVDTMLEMKYLEVTESKENKNGDSRTAELIRHRSTHGSIQVSNGIELRDIPIPDSVNGMVLTRIDHMSASEQMTLKCAAIAGTVFKKRMLQAVIPNCNSLIFNKSLNILADAGIFECAIAAEVRRISTDLEMDSSHRRPSISNCPCLEKYAHLRRRPQRYQTLFPPIDECETLQFVHNYVQETAYNLWTESQRKTLHESAACFLESEAHKCKHCGGGPFIEGRENTTLKYKKQAVSWRLFIGGARNNRLRPGPRTAETEKCNSSIKHRDEVTDVPPLTVASEADDGGMMGIDLYRIFANNDVNMENCYCNEILANIYPQLVRHWRAAGNMQNTIMYLIEEGSAALATCNNMEALSLLQEAKSIIKNSEEILVHNLEYGRLESLIGQAFFQMEHLDVSIPHMYAALRLLRTRVPRTLAGGSFTLLYHSFKQLFHIKFPSCVSQIKRRESFLDKARCFAYLSRAYHLQDKNVMSIIMALKRLNSAEQVREYFTHELIEAYAAMIECCQQFDLRKLASHYFSVAISYCNNVELHVDEVHGFAHLLSVGLNLKLYQGNITEALSIGTICYNIIAQIHDVSMEFSILPLLFFCSMARLNHAKTVDALKQLAEVANEAAESRAQASYDCCHFEGLLEFGLDQENEYKIVNMAETCCNELENIYYCDQVERFFLLSCLALWHARRGNYNSAHRYSNIVKEIHPKKLKTYIAVRAQSRYTECSLLLMHHFSTKPDIANAKKAMKKFRLGSLKYRALESRYYHFSAYYNMIVGRPLRARHLLNRALIEALHCGSLYDGKWCQQSRQLWFESDEESSHGSGDSEDVYMFKFKMT